MRRTTCRRNRESLKSNLSLSYAVAFLGSEFWQEETLTAYSSGGVFVTGSGGKIELNNTFEERLKMCETDALPNARRTLFGENENRRFTN